MERWRCALVAMRHAQVGSHEGALMRAVSFALARACSRSPTLSLLGREAARLLEREAARCRSGAKPRVPFGREDARCRPGAKPRVVVRARRRALSPGRGDAPGAGAARRDR